MAMLVTTINGQTVMAIEEAPEDGKLYGRKDAAWEEVDAIGDAPLDGKEYARKDGAWEPLPDLTEAARLKEEYLDAMERANDPSKDNPFLTLKDMPYLEKRVAAFELMEKPKGTGTLYGAAFGDGAFVAVGDGCAVRSVDGRKWEAAPNVPAGAWRGVAEGGSVFAAVGLDGAAMWSGDGGASWNLGVAPEGDWGAITFGNGRFVAVTEGKAMTSLDGKTGWTAKAVPPGHGDSVAFGNGVFTAIGMAGAMTSTDGETWTPVVGPKATWRCVDWGDGKFVALGGKCMSSEDDGATWAASGLPSGGWDAVKSGGGFFVAVGNRAQRIVSASGILDWEQTAVPNFMWRGLAFGLDTFVAVGSGIMAARIVDVAAALNGANGPNGTNVFMTRDDVEAHVTVLTEQIDALSAKVVALEAHAATQTYRGAYPDGTALAADRPTDVLGALAFVEATKTVWAYDGTKWADTTPRATQGEINELISETFVP